MNFTFNFVYSIVNAFTTLWAPRCCVPVCDITVTSTNATATGRRRTRARARARTRVPRSATEVSGSVSRRPILRRSARLRHKYAVPPKPILPSARRRLRRENAIVDLQQLEPGTLPTSGNTPIATPHQQQLKREDSFILVDYGNHFKMVKPAEAMRYFHTVPENVRTVAPYHAFGTNVEEQVLRARLLAVPISTAPPKRVRFVEEEEEHGDEVGGDARPRKTRRLS